MRFPLENKIIVIMTICRFARQPSAFADAASRHLKRAEAGGSSLLALYSNLQADVRNEASIAVCHLNHQKSLCF